MGQDFDSNSGGGQTVVGWEPGEYEKQKSNNREWILRLLILGIVLVCVCTMVAVAVGSYYYV